MTIATASYDLLTEPWIPVVEGDGKAGEMGLLETLERADELRQIADPSPLATFAIYRFLAAVLHAYLKLEDYDEWVAAWDAGRFSPNLLARVRAGCEGRLQLFDPDLPFYQSNDMTTGDSGANVVTVGYLAIDASTGTNVVHFSHAGDADHEFCPACCAKGLLTISSSAIAEGRSWTKSLNGDPPLFIAPLGDNLFRTLLLNYVLPAFRPQTAMGPKHKPLWEGSGVLKSSDVRTSVEFVEGLTWAPRKVRLLPVGKGTCSRCGRQSATLVGKMLRSPGWIRDKDAPAWEDPWVAYELTKGKNEGPPVRKPIRLKEHRATWRDFTGLFMSQEGVKGAERFQSARVILQLVTLMRDDNLSQALPLSLQTFGLRTDGQAKVFESQGDTFTFPPAILLRSNAIYEIQAALARAEQTGTDIATSMGRLNRDLDREYDKAGRRSGKAIVTKAEKWGPVKYAQHEYWQLLEPQFRAAVSNPLLVGDTADRGEWAKAWEKEVRQSALSAFERAIEGFDGTAEMLRRRQRASDQFYRSIMARGGDR